MLSEKLEKEIEELVHDYGKANTLGEWMNYAWRLREALQILLDCAREGSHIEHRIKLVTKCGATQNLPQKFSERPFRHQKHVIMPLKSNLAIAVSSESEASEEISVDRRQFDATMKFDREGDCIYWIYREV
jgi:hypothetical protein